MFQIKNYEYRNQQISLTDTIRETSVDTKLHFQRIFLNVH